MMTIYLIRHSITEGNKKKRYIGKTDEELCKEGRELLEKRQYPACEVLYVSPMLRCRQTAQIIYPDKLYRILDDFRECDFGIFENKNYEELAGCPEYQEWIDSNGTLPFPKGESREEFCRRTLQGFAQVLEECRRNKIRSAGLVVHGGSIMSIMEEYGIPAGSYYDYQIGNGEGYELYITDDVSGSHRICAGSDSGRSGVALSPGQADRTSDHWNGKNYKKLFSEDEER